MKEETAGHPSVVGGVDTHKDLHMAAVVDEHDRVLGSQCFATTRHGYKQMMAWMRSFGELLASVWSVPERMAQAFCATCSALKSRCWK